MERRYTYATTLRFGTDGEPDYAEVDVEVSFSVAWGSPESGRFGPPENYDPGCGDVVEDIKLLTVEGKPRPWGMGYGLISDDAFAETVAERLEAEHGDMVASATEDEVAAEDDHADYLRRSAIDDRLTRIA